MSTKSADGSAGADGWTPRGRGAGRGRPGRSRGRGRGSSFSFIATVRHDTLSSDNDAVPPPSANGHVANSDAKRKPFRKSSNARRGSTATGTTEEAVATATGSKPSLEKELPPHIAGAAVDAESLVNRVKELAINGHGHTSSVESRFSTHFDWADEEDDPDSLPDLDDWAIPSKSIESPDKKADAFTVQDLVSPKPKAAIPVTVTDPAREEELGVQEDSSSNPLEAETAQTDAVPSIPASDLASEGPPSERPTTPKRPRQGLEASIWASSSPTSPPTQIARSPRGRGHTRSASHRPSTNPNQTFRPTHFNRNSVAEILPFAPPSAQGLKVSPRKPHTRPIISGAALANISRTLGRDSSHPHQQSTPT